MRLRYLFTLLFLVLLSCVKEEEVVVPSDSAVTTTISYRAVVQSSPQSRASIDGPFGTGHYIFQSGDRLFVVDSSTGGSNLYGVLTLVEGADTGTGTFEGTINTVGAFELANDTELAATLVGANAQLYTYTIAGDKIKATTYPSSIAYEAGGLAEYIKKYSHFTAAPAPFSAHSFTLTQQTVFVDCTIKDIPKNSLANSDETCVFINKGESTIRSFTGIPVSSGTYLGDISFMAVLSASEDVSSGEIWYEDSSVSENHCLPDISPSLSLQANRYYSLSRKATEWTGFKIKATEDDTNVTFQFSGSGIQYSRDNGRNWIPYNEIASLKLNAGESICWKGARTEYNCKGNKQLFTADNHNLCYISGNITSLLSDPNSLNANAFRSAFSYGNLSDGNDGLDKEKNLSDVSGTVDWVNIDSEDPLILPASTSTNCYVEMFAKCTSLTWAPELPATTLADKCYFRMFYGCTGLSSIASLPSEVHWNGTSSRQRYFFQMYQGCTGIKKLEGSLPSDNLELAPNCFEDMFANCTSLKSVSSGFLPATTLAASCYRGMFQSTKIAQTPDLPASTLVSECYRYMFNGCSQLTHIKCLATTYIGNGYTTNWVGGNVPNTSDCKFVSADEATTSWPRDVNGILSNWTIKPVSAE